MALKKNNPGCNCCDEVEECAHCASGTTPATLTVTVSGWGNGSNCSDCATLNGNYVCTQANNYTAAPEGQAGDCTWRADGPTFCSGKTSYVAIRLFDFPGGGVGHKKILVYLVINVLGVDLFARYSHEFSSAPDCDTINLTALTFDSTIMSSYCDESGVSVDVVA